MYFTFQSKIMFLNLQPKCTLYVFYGIHSQNKLTVPLNIYCMDYKIHYILCKVIRLVEKRSYKMGGTQVYLNFCWWMQNWLMLNGMDACEVLKNSQISFPASLLFFRWQKETCWSVCLIKLAPPTFFIHLTEWISAKTKWNSMNVK